MSIRVLQVIGSMNRGGAETMIMNLYRQIDKNKVQFDFVESTTEKAAYDDEIETLGGKIYHCPHFNGKNIISYKQWWKDFFAKHHNEYKVVHGHIGSTSAIYLSEAKKHGCYCIAHSHNMNAKHSLNQYMYNALSYKTRFIADYCFACSEKAGKDRFGNRMVKGENYSILNNAINTEQFKYDENTRVLVRKELGISEDIFVIGHVGRFMYQKNHEFLIEIIAELVQKNSKVKLLLVGDGELRTDIEQKIEELHLKEQVIMTGIRSDVNRMYQAMDMLVFPSRFEGLPVTLVEAQTAGLPCVISGFVPRDSILVDNLVTIKGLDDCASDWAEHIISRMKETRCDTSLKVAEAGFDIVQSAKWIEEFYLEKNG